MHTVIVPTEDWATVEIADLTNREPLHDNNHTLTCIVNVDPGLNIDPEVHWYLPDGTLVGVVGQVREGSQVSTGLKTKRELYFSPLLHGHGGEYTCEAKIHIPWMTTQPVSDTYKMVVTSKTI